MPKLTHEAASARHERRKAALLEDLIEYVRQTQRLPTYNEIVQADTLKSAVTYYRHFGCVEFMNPQLIRALRGCGETELADKLQQQLDATRKMGSKRTSTT